MEVSPGISKWKFRVCQEGVFKTDSEAARKGTHTARRLLKSELPIEETMADRDRDGGARAHDTRHTRTLKTESG